MVVGLGNPGPDYVWTRHNVGFHVVERIAQAGGALFEPARRLDGYRGPRAFRFARLPEPAALLVKPETFMNLSGEVVAPLARFLAPDERAARARSQEFAPAADPAVADELEPGGARIAAADSGAPPEAEAAAEERLARIAGKILVVYDDLDLPLGQLRIRPHGSAGGQRGMKSIIEHLGTNRLPRLRVGIGRPGTDAARYVLQRFPAEERVEIEISVAEAAEAILDWLRSGDIEACMARFHSRWNQDS